jgi:hypothetical protein
MFRGYVRAEDFASATRLHWLYRSDDQGDYPGHTAFSISRPERPRTDVHQELAVPAVRSNAVRSHCAASAAAS